MKQRNVDFICNFVFNSLLLGFASCILIWALGVDPIFAILCVTFVAIMSGMI